jgi:TctA family transporter
VQNSGFDIWLMLVFGGVGYLFKKLDYPLAPLVLALVLGDRAEDAFRQALIGSAGNLEVFMDNGLVSSLMVLSFVLLLWGPIAEMVGRLRRRAVAPSPAA